LHATSATVSGSYYKTEGLFKNNMTDFFGVLLEEKQ
jgi:hypothetical protein